MTTGLHGPRLSGWQRTVAFAALFTATCLLGRVSAVGTAQLAMFWPASAVGFLWLLGSWSSATRRLVDVAVLFAVCVPPQLLTGRSGALALSMALAGVVHPVVTCLVFVRLLPDRRLRRLPDLLALLLAALAGSAAAAGVAAVALAPVDGVALLPMAGQWTLRNLVSTFVLAAVGLCPERPQPAPAGSRAKRSELLLMLAAAVATYGVVFGVPHDRPLAFLVLPLAVWVGLRLSTRSTAWFNVGMAVTVVALTTLGRGPFAAFTVHAQGGAVLVAQTFVAVAALLSLVLALYRDALDHVTQGLGQARQAAVEQAELLAAVFESISDGVLVVDAEGRTLMHNAAARQLFGLDLDRVEPAAWSQHYGLSHVDGSAFPSTDLPLARALRGHRDTGVDLLAAGPAHPEGLVLSTTARPLPGPPGAHGAVAAFHDVTYARRAAAEVARARDLLATVLTSATEQAIISTDTAGRITLFNRGAEAMLGHPAAQMLGQTPVRLHDPAEIATRAAELGIEPGFAVLVHGVGPGRPDTRPWTYVTATGDRRDVVVSVTALHDGTARQDGLGTDGSGTDGSGTDGPGEVTGYLGIAVDVTEQRRAERALQVSELRFRQAFTTAPMGMFLAAPTQDGTSRLIQVNQALCDLLGRSAEQIVAAGVAPFVHQDDAAVLRDSWAQLLAGAAGTVRDELRFVRPDGRTVWGLVSGSWVPGQGGVDGQVMGLVEDITVRKQAQETLTKQALHDPLTGLPNRTLLFDRLTHALAGAGRTGGGVGVLYLDLDGFKAVNDRAGHAAGDELLRQVARRLTSTVRPGDTVARLGGDEFAVFCPDTDDRRNLRAVAERVVQVLRRPFVLVDGNHSVSVSVGMALSGPGSTPAQLLKDADAAMYGAKRAGKDRLGGHDEVRPPGIRQPGHPQPGIPRQCSGAQDVEPVREGGGCSGSRTPAGP